MYHPWYTPRRCRILVARNAESFSFVYAETLDLLSSLGSVEFFDPEEDFPSAFLAGEEESALLYLPGGYPEKHLDALVRGVRHAVP